MTWMQRIKDSSLSVRILTGLGLGICTGLFFGEYAAGLQPVADIYIRLMQMTVLPYLITSLIIAFGSLKITDAKKLAFTGGVLLLLVWVVTSLILMLMPLTFPFVENASFYSSSLVEPPQSFSLIELYFTANPFESLSLNVVPAVVLFSSLIGIGLIGLPDKENLLSPLRTWNAAIVQITRFIISLTPIGVFAITSVAMGTTDPEMLHRLEIYFIAFGLAALLLAFVILPLLVTAVTPFKYREVVSLTRDALLTAFVANSAFIVLPVLVERSKKLMEKYAVLDPNADSAAEVLVPVMFNFPTAGKLMTLLFIPFAAWLSGSPLASYDYPTLFSVGIPSYFAKAQVALPFLLDLFGLPHDTVQVYIPTTIITGKFDSMLTAMNLLVFALLGAGAIGGFLVFELKRILRVIFIMVSTTVLMVIVTRVMFSTMFNFEYRMHEVLANMHTSRPVGESIVHTKAPAELARESQYDELTVMERINSRGTLRIGYDSQNLPMSFFNSNGELVGFDIEVAQHLAAALGAKAEFVPVRWPELADMLSNGQIDVMPGIWYRPYWFSSIKLSSPYLQGTMGFALRDDRRNEFTTIEKIRDHESLKIGVPLDRTQIASSMEYYFDGMNVEFKTVEFWQPYFEGEHPELDAFLMPVENATAWTLLHPDYAVVVPQPSPVKIPSAFGLAHDAKDLKERIDEWIVFAESAGIIERAHTYWIQGQGAEEKPPRWSIVRNVLHWVE